MILYLRGSSSTVITWNMFCSYSLLFILIFLPFPFSLTHSLHSVPYIQFNFNPIGHSTDPFATEGKEKDEINKLMRDVLASDGTECMQTTNCTQFPSL